MFAFDTLAQNPDRRAGTPNLWVRSDCIGVYDHEQAFSFLSVPIIGGAPRPWLAASQGNGFRFLEQHIFYRSLRGGRLNLGPFEAKLGALSDSRIRAYAESVPSEWGTQDELCARVAEYLWGSSRATGGSGKFYQTCVKMKTTYSMITLRYVHDVVTGSLRTSGWCFTRPSGGFWKRVSPPRSERLNAIFLKIDHAHFRAMMRYMANEFDEVSAEIRDGLSVPPVTALTEIARRVLPQDDSSLQWSEQGGGFSDDPAGTVGELYRRLVERYIPGVEQAGRTVEEIVKPFKGRLGEASAKLSPKRIEANDYQYQFRFGWRNAIWHLYEPVTFDLVDPNSIREKAVRWYGRSAALQETPEEFKIHFLLGEPRQPGTEEAFKNALHLLSTAPGQKEIVRERDIEELAARVAEEIAGHASSEMVLRDKTKGA